MEWYLQMETSQQIQNNFIIKNGKLFRFLTKYLIKKHKDSVPIQFRLIITSVQEPLYKICSFSHPETHTLHLSWPRREFRRSYKNTTTNDPRLSQTKRICRYFWRYSNVQNVTITLSDQFIKRLHSGIHLHQNHLGGCRNSDKSITVTTEANNRTLVNLRIKKDILIDRLGLQLWKTTLFHCMWICVVLFLIRYFWFKKKQTIRYFTEKQRNIYDNTQTLGMATLTQFSGGIPEGATPDHCGDASGKEKETLDILFQTYYSS